MILKKCFLLILFPVLNVVYAQNNRSTLFVGTYTNTCSSKGIYIFDFDTQTADYTLKTTSDSIINPSFIAITDDKKNLYSVNENAAESTISAFEYDSKKEVLNFINSQDSKGADPCSIIADQKNVMVANYSGGNVVVFGKNSDGSLTPAKQVIQLFGKSINPKRQEKPHAHMVHFSPSKKHVVVTDLGSDKVYIYKYNPDSKQSVLNLKETISVKEGSGPRHVTFSKNGKFLYLLQELDATLTVYRFENGKLQKIQETKLVKPDFDGKNGAADIHFSPDGTFLYATNRGTANEIVCYTVQKNGRLKFKFSKSTLGLSPRNFAIDPDGNYLLIANQKSNVINIFRLNKLTGDLLDTDKTISLCEPVCLVFTK